LFHPRLKSLAEKALPHFLTARLDPVREIIESEVRTAAAAMAGNHVVLDAGAGEARHRRFFARGCYVALDSGTGDRAWDYSRLDIQGDLERLPLKPGTVDRVLCMVVLEHTRNPRQVLSEFVRVLKPGGVLHMVVPLLWEEHQAPHDYWRFTRYGVRLLADGLPLRIELLRPMGGFFRVCARRCISSLAFFQRGWRWFFFFLFLPLFGLLLPLLLYYMDPLDRGKEFTLGFLVRATRERD